MTKNRRLADHIIDVEIKILADTVVPPQYQSAGAAGLDLVSARPGTVKVEPGQVEKIGTGIAVHIGEPGVVGLVFPRSGRATKEGLVLANTVGVIDSDYQGEIICMVRNQSDKTLVIVEGERIAQLVFMPVYVASLVTVTDFASETVRGTGGFGSTGIDTARAAKVTNTEERDHLVGAAAALGA